MRLRQNRQFCTSWANVIDWSDWIWSDDVADVSTYLYLLYCIYTYGNIIFFCWCWSCSLYFKWITSIWCGVDICYSGINAPKHVSGHFLHLRRVLGSNLLLFRRVLFFLPFLEMQLNRVHICCDYIRKCSINFWKLCRDRNKKLTRSNVYQYKDLSLYVYQFSGNWILPNALKMKMNQFFRWGSNLSAVDPS